MGVRDMMKEEIPNAIRKHGQRIARLEEALRVYEARLDAQAVTIDEQRKLLDCAAEAVFAVADAGKAAETTLGVLAVAQDRTSSALALIQQNYFVAKFGCAHGLDSDTCPDCRH